MPVPTSRWRALIDQVCQETPPVDPVVLEAMVLVESNGEPDAVSASDARGLCQLIPRWHADGVGKRVAEHLGKELTDELWFDPEFSLRAGALHLRWCQTDCGSSETGVARYHSGQCHPPSDFVDGQGTSTVFHLVKFREALAAVRADRFPDQEGHQTMALTIKRMMIPETNVNYPNALLSAGELYITVHETGNQNAGANALHEATFLKNGGGPDTVAFHFAVDENEAYQCLPLNQIGWHAGDGCESRADDVGCYRSVAIETCVHTNNKHKNESRANLIKLIAAICAGDPQIDYGGTGPMRFSPARIAPHHRWSNRKKDCPHFMLEDGYMWTIATKAGAALGAVAGSMVSDAEPLPIPELEPFKSGSPDSIPAFVTVADGTRFWFVGDRVQATRDTPRYQMAHEGSSKVGPDIRAGEEFDIDWVFLSDDGQEWYITPFNTRVRVADTKRVADRRVVA